MSTDVELTIEERVAAGAAWLDQHRPGWIARIDLDKLNVGSVCNCILGQEFGRFSYAPEAAYEDDREAFERGFDLGDIAAETYDDLTAEWRRLIESRRVAS